MTEIEWRDLFARLGIRAGELRTVLRCRTSSLMLYFNPPLRDHPEVGFYFAARLRHHDRYPSELWERIDPTLFGNSMRMRRVCLGTFEPVMILANGHAHYLTNLQ